MRFTKLLWLLVVKTMAHRVCVHITMNTTMGRLFWTKTATISKRFAIALRRSELVVQAGSLFQNQLVAGA